MVSYFVFPNFLWRLSAGASAHQGGAGWFHLESLHPSQPKHSECQSPHHEMPREAHPLFQSVPSNVILRLSRVRPSSFPPSSWGAGYIQDMLTSYHFKYMNLYKVSYSAMRTLIILPAVYTFHTHSPLQFSAKSVMTPSCQRRSQKTFRETGEAAGSQSKPEGPGRCWEV